VAETRDAEKWAADPEKDASRFEADYEKLP